MPDTNRQWLLVHRPEGALAESDFRRVDSPVPVPDLAGGEILLRNRWIGFDAAQREWIKDQEGYFPPVGLGEVMRASTVAEVLRSANPAYPEGSLVQGLYGWQDYALASPADPMPPNPLPPGVSPEMALSALGSTALTAWAGLVEVGGLAAGQTVLVSAAAGATGSMALQIAKLRGARAIGIAGGSAKCAWLRDTLGADGVIDYRAEDIGERLAALCPAGVDLFFDNVGGVQLEAAIEHLAPRGRVVLCGQIAGYDAPEPPPGPRNLQVLIMRRARMEGFLLLDHLHRAPDALAEIGGWLAAGKLRWNADVQHGFEAIPRTLLRLLHGQNLGKQLLALD